MSDINYRSNAYTIPSEPFKSADNILEYLPKKWEDEEIIDRVEMNNIEQGILIALEQTSTIQNTAEEAVENVRQQIQSFNERANEISEALDTAQTTIENSVATQLETNNTNITTTLSNLLGAAYASNTALPWSLPSGMNSVDARIAELYSQIFDNSNNSNISSLQQSLNDLDTYTRGASNANSLTNQILALQNELGGNNSGTSFKAKIENAIGRPLEPTAAQIAEDANVGISLLESIESLQQILGVGANTSSEGDSLITKIEKALGISLDSADNPAITIETKNLSLYTMIRQLQGVLGIEGGTSSGSSSNLVESVNLMLDLLYGYSNDTTTEEDPETGETITTVERIRNVAPSLDGIELNNGYLTLYQDFYSGANGSIPSVLSNLQTSVSETQSSIQTLSSTVGSYNTILEDLSNAYREADIRTYDNTNSYLILKSNLEEADAETESEIEGKTNKYVLLPKMGGGGGTTYELDASFINKIIPENNIITVGDAYNLGFTWQVTQEEDNVSIDGTLTIRLNGTVVDTQFIMSNTPYVFNLGQYISASGRNVFTLTASNVAVPSRTLYTTIVAYNAVLESTFNPSVIQTGSSISYTYTASIGSGSIEKVLHISIDGQEISLNGNSSISESARTISFPTPSEGDHLIEVWFTANVGTIENPITIFSNRINYGILCGLSVNTRIATNFNQTTIEQYNTLFIDYLVVTPNQDTTTVYFYFGDSTPIVENVNATYQHIEYPVTQAGGTLNIRIVAGNAEKLLQVEVIVNTSYDFSAVDSQLQVYLTANQKTNAGSDRNSWLNSAPEPSANFQNIQGVMENFLFYNTNNFDGWLRDTNGQSYLRLRNRDKVTINLPIFNFDIDANSRIVDGLTFEVDFKTSDVTNYDAEIISCYEEGQKNARNIIFTAQKAIINNSIALSTQFKEEERLTLTFVVENSSRGPLYQLFKIYINGILSAAAQYETTALNFSDPSKAKIVLGSEECTLDIYSIRFYNRALTFPEVIKNWIANTGSYNDKINNFNKNNYADSQGRISFQGFLAASPTTPYMVISGNGDWNNDDGRQAMPTTKSEGTYSTSDKNIKVEYHDAADNGKNSFTTDFTNGEVGIAIQGTSSQEYKRKNYKIKLTAFQQNGITHIKKPEKSVNKDQYFEEEYDENNNRVYRTLKEGYSKEGYKLIDTSLPTFTFCIKADVASSESTNNTELTKIYDEIVRKIELTPPQGDDARVRQGVDGYPIVVWYYNQFTQEYTFLGKYNFNNDKGTEEVYGFEDGDESWEVGNNEKLLCFFDESEDPEWANWRQAFETRFPDDDDSLTKTEDPYTDAQIADRLAGLRQMVHWISSNVNWVDSNKEAVTFNNTPNSDDIARAVVMGTQPAAEAFKREFKQYFNIDLMTFFYVYTEFFLMVDNRAKNMFLTRYRVANDRPNNTVWHNTYGDNIVELQASTSTTDTYSGWFSLPYDMDTGLGTNNVGVYKFGYHYETGDYQPDGSVVFNGQKSKLWVAFKQVFGSEIQNMYTTFQTNLTYTSVEQIFEKHQGVWSETVFNEDMEAKYIDWITGYDENQNPTTRDDRALPMLLGSKQEQRKWWLENRFVYLNSKYALDAGRDFISLGVRKGQLNIPVTVYADAYVTFKVGAQDSAPITKRVLVGETQYIQRDTSNETGAGDRVESSLSPASRIRSVENLADLELNNADFSRATRLQILRIGSPYKINTRLNAINLSGNKLLRLFDLRNCSNYSNDLSLSNCLSLEKLYLYGTAMQNVILPQGGILKTIQYPTSITTIKIENQPYLENLIIGNVLPSDEITDSEHEVSDANHENDYSNINALYLDNVGIITGRENSINSLEIVEQMNENGFLYLDGISWEMTASEFYEIFQKIDPMYGFINGQPSTEQRASLGGVLYLSGQFPEGFSLEDIALRFGNKLRVIFIDDQGQEHEYYTVLFYGLKGDDLLETQYVAGGQTAVNPAAKYFTEDYINEFNLVKNSSWQPGDSTKWNFSGWDRELSNISERTEIRAQSQLQYRMNFVLQTADPEVSDIRYDYFFEGTRVSDDNIPVDQFERNYYLYTRRYWTLNSNQEADSYETGDTREQVPQNAQIKNNNADGIQTWYSVYSRTPQVYAIKIYNSDLNGDKVGEPLGTLERAVIAGNISNYVRLADVAEFTPNATNRISIEIPSDNPNYSIAQADKDKDDADRTFRFLGWKPYISSTLGLKVTGNMDILITYYSINDYFTNYFTNKLVNCNLGSSITTLPEAAFFHSSNLRRLETYATTVGSYSFANFGEYSAPRRIFVFDANNVDFSPYCFYGIKNAIIVFLGTGQIRVNNYSFNNMENCNILVPNSDQPIRVGSGDRSYCFTNFLNNRNKLYVKNRDSYPNSIYSSTDYDVPSYLIASERQAIIQINESNQDYQALKEEAGF